MSRTSSSPPGTAITTGSLITTESRQATPEDPLRRRSVGPPAARSMLLTILGEYLLMRPDGVWQETLVGALCAMGYSVQASRQALARSTRQGWLTSERHGRRVRVTISAGTRAMLVAGAERIYGFGEPREWDGQWLLVIVRVPEAQREIRHRLRTRLAWAGFGSLGGGLWITPHAEREQEVLGIVEDAHVADVVSFKGSLAHLGTPQQVVDAAWDLAVVRTAYEAFLVEFSPADSQTPQQCFERQTTMVHDWRKFPFLDPDLPPDLLGDDWPRTQAHDLFLARHTLWEARARDYFDALEASVVSG